MSTRGPFNLWWPIRVNFALNWSFCVFSLVCRYVFTNRGRGDYRGIDMGSRTGFGLLKKVKNLGLLKFGILQLYH